ncbi:MAG: PmoA family protein, partial [Candidatus Hydrogenedentes bacterium]|nr:PmoA family protein [Candidatus Hydrogenedentota bacterium]
VAERNPHTDSNFGRAAIRYQTFWPKRRGGGRLWYHAGDESNSTEDTRMMMVLLGPLLTLPMGAAEPPFPLVQAIPMPGRQAAFEIEGREAARYHYDASYHRPFVFPLIGPAGRPVTRLTHPHDPDGHGHHLSVWVAHRSVNGANFWENGDARIVHQAIEQYKDGATAASLTVRNAWTDGAGAALLDERRTIALHALPDDERYLDVAIELAPAGAPVTFGATPFGFLAVRVAKTMSVADGGGTIRNSEGGVDEEGVFWKRARWVDYTGRVTPDERNGVTFFDHPSNPRYPAFYHVRNDGWMGASFTKDEPFILAQGETLTLRYRLFVHGADAAPERIEQHWQRWADSGAD